MMSAVQAESELCSWGCWKVFFFDVVVFLLIVLFFIFKSEVETTEERGEMRLNRCRYGGEEFELSCLDSNCFSSPSFFLF